jgi:lipopolysaccharide transport system permease protein
MDAFRFLWQYRHVLWHTTKNDIRARYTGSALGMAWAILNPLLLLSIYVFVYQIIFKFRMPGLSTREYVIIIFSGQLPYFGFSECITGSLTSVTGNANLLRSTYFPVPALPVKAILAGMFSQIMGTCILLVFLLYFGKFSIYWLFLPIALAIQLLFTIGLGWICSVLHVFFRDLGQVISVILLFLMFMSPIFWLPEMLSGPMRFILYLNPLYYIISLYRQPLFYGVLPAWHIIIIITGVSTVLFMFGFRFFIRIKPHLVDYV